MIGPFVADASVGASWVLPAQASDESIQLLDSLETGGSLIVPALWPLEVTNSLLACLRRKIITTGQWQQGLGFLRQLKIVLDDEGARLAFQRVAALAAEHGLSIYDAVYLELALRRNLALATRDLPLRQAAQRCQVTLLLSQGITSLCRK